MNIGATGKNGEDRVSEYLRRQGYKVLLRNFVCKTGEIDIIAEEDEYIVFVEVKTRRSTSFGTALEAVTMEKAKKIIVTSVVYLYENPSKLQTRYDIIEVYSKGDNKYSVNHYKNAFSMEDAYEPL